MVPASGQPSGSGEQRVRCLYCGANNFAGSVSCWQCARTLVAMRDPEAAPAGSAPASPGFAPPPSRPLGFSALSAAAINATASAGRANKAALWMGLLFPWVGIPAGMIFLMLDDDRKAQLGWIMIGWSLAGLAVNVIAGVILSGILMSGLHSLIPSGSLHNPNGGASTPSLPDIGDGDNIVLPAALSLIARILPALS